MSQPVPSGPNAEIAAPVSAKSLIPKLLFGSIAVAGVVTAVSALVPGESGAMANAFAMVWLIVATDILILLGLVARHGWLRSATWLTAALGLILGAFGIWTSPAQEYYMDGAIFTPSTTALHEVVTNFSIGSYMFSSILVLLSIFSLAAARFRAEKVEWAAYQATLGLGVVTGTLFALSIGLWRWIGDMSPQWPLRFGVATMFLAMAAASIAIISLMMRTVRENGERRRLWMEQQAQQMPRGPQQWISPTGSIPYPGPVTTQPPVSQPGPVPTTPGATPTPDCPDPRGTLPEATPFQGPQRPDFDPPREA